MRDRYCQTHKMVPWVKALYGTKFQKVCIKCARPTKASAPRPPKNRNADRKWSREGRALANGKCEHCELPGSDGGHGLPKSRYPHLRHDPRNRVHLSRACHQYFTSHPAEWRAWLRENRPQIAALMDQEGVKQ